MSKISTIEHEICKDFYRDAVEDDNIDQYIRDILELIKSQMPNGLNKSWILIISIIIIVISMILIIIQNIICDLIII